MPDGTERWSLEEYRAYLRIVARANLRHECRSLLDSSDLIQQTMLKAWDKRDQFQGSTAKEYRGWLCRMLANEAYDRARQEGLIGDDPARKRSLEQALEESDARLVKYLALDSPAPPDQAIKRETLLNLDKALVQLPERQREVVVLHMLQGYSVEETAQSMNLTKTAVGGLYARALKKLRKLLEETP